MAKKLYVGNLGPEANEEFLTALFSMFGKSFSTATTLSGLGQIGRSFDKGGTLPEDISGIGKSGQTYKLHKDEIVTPAGGGSPTIIVNGDVDGKNTLRKIIKALKEYQKTTGVAYV